MSASIEASLRLEIAQYQEALAKARGEVQRFKENIKRDSASLGSDFLGPLKGQIAGLLPALSASAVVAGVHEIISGMDDLADASNKLSTVPETFQRVQTAAEVLGGTDMDTVTSALIRLRRQLMEDPGSALAQGLKQVGINATEFLRLDADAQILQLADAYAKAQASGADLPLLNEAFGKSFKELIPLLAAGREELSKTMSEARVMSNEVVLANAAISDALDKGMQKQASSFKEFVGMIVLTLDALLDSNKTVSGEMDKLQESAQAAIDKAKAAREAAASEAETKAAQHAAKQATKNAGLDVDHTKEINDASAKAIEATERAIAKRDAAKRKMDEESMTREEKIAAIKERIAAIDAEPADPFGPANPDAEIEKETRKIELQTELNRLLREQQQLTAQAAQEIGDEASADAEKATAKQKALASLMEELALLQAKARHDDKAVAAMERELEIRRKTQQIVEQTGLDEARARNAATQMVDLEAAAKDGAGGSGRTGMRKRYMGGHLSDFTRLQNSAFGSGTLSRGTGALSERAAIAAGQQDDRNRKDTSLHDILRKQNEILTKGIL